MSKELPHATVATIVEQDGKYLLVKERREGKIVYNQPAGHIENGESIIEAALRETLEETCWDVKPTGVVDLTTYHAPNGITYVRTTIIATPVRQKSTKLDEDILEALWLSYDQICELDAKGQLRSPTVKRVIDDYRGGRCYPLDLISEQR